MQGGAQHNKYHIEDVHRAGGIYGILGELDRAGKLHTDVPTVHTKTLKEALDAWDIKRNPSDAVKPSTWPGTPAGIPTQVAFSQAPAGPAWTKTAPKAASAPSRARLSQGRRPGRADRQHRRQRLRGQDRRRDDSLLVFEGPAHVVESRDEAVANILADKVKAGDVVIVRYEGPKGGPGMQEMLYPPATSSPGPGQSLRAADRWPLSGGTSACPSATPRLKPLLAARLAVRNGDRIPHRHPNRSINVLVSDEELAAPCRARRWVEACAATSSQGVCRTQGLRQAGHVGR